MSVAVELKNVDVIFGKNTRDALAMVDMGKSRSEIQKETGAVLGCIGANLQVHEGEISVLMGLSGSGKSTLLRTINGLNKVSRGNVLVRDGDKMVDIATCDKTTLRHVRQNQVAMVFQQFALFPWRTVGQNVGFGLEVYGVSDAEYKSRVEKQLKIVGLDQQWENSFPHELSWGMQQRVGLARALATDASILLMDEPFSALDPLIRVKLQDELLQLQKTLKKTIIFVSHDLEEALKIGSHITIMEGGRIVQTGKPQDIVLHSANDYVREFIINMNSLNVLTANSIMRRINELEPDKEEWIWLDQCKTTRIKLGNNNQVVAVERNGRATNWIPCINAKNTLENEHHFVFTAIPSISLRTVLLAIQKNSAAPVILLDNNNIFSGVICARDLLPVISKSFVN